MLRQARKQRHTLGRLEPAIKNFAYILNEHTFHLTEFEIDVLIHKICVVRIIPLNRYRQFSLENV